MKILYVVANQEISQAVVAFTNQVAQRTDSSITFFVVVEDEENLQDARQSITEAEESFGETLIKTHQMTGKAVPLILEEIEAGEYDLMILGVGRRRRLVPSGFRLLSHKIIKFSPIPVMLVRDACIDFDRMLICTGGGEISEPVVAFSAELAKAASLKATLLYVTRAVPSMYTGMDEVEETLEELLETDTPIARHLRASAEVLMKNLGEADVKIRQGDVAETILQEAGEAGCDLVVLGATAGGTVAGMLMGNVTQQIVNRAKSAVLIIK
jgi:nucleotide-binding universal stress UspA family protein